MLPAIDFDRDADLQAGEIKDIGRDRMLTPEPLAAKLAVAQVLPQAPLGVGRQHTHASGAVLEDRVAHGASAYVWEACPHPNPPPLGGGGDELSRGRGVQS